MHKRRPTQDVITKHVVGWHLTATITINPCGPPGGDYIRGNRWIQKRGPPTKKIQPAKNLGPSFHIRRAKHGSQTDKPTYAISVSMQAMEQEKLPTYITRASGWKNPSTAALCYPW